MGFFIPVVAVGVTFLVSQLSGCGEEVNEEKKNTDVSTPPPPTLQNCPPSFTKTETLDLSGICSGSFPYVQALVQDSTETVYGSCVSTLQPTGSAASSVGGIFKWNHQSGLQRFSDPLPTPNTLLKTDGQIITTYFKNLQISGYGQAGILIYDNQKPNDPPLAYPFPSVPVSRLVAVGANFTSAGNKIQKDLNLDLPGEMAKGTGLNSDRIFIPVSGAVSFGAAGRKPEYNPGGVWVFNLKTKSYEQFYPIQGLYNPYLVSSSGENTIKVLLNGVIDRYGVASTKGGIVEIDLVSSKQTLSVDLGNTAPGLGLGTGNQLLAGASFYISTANNSGQILKVSGNSFTPLALPTSMGGLQFFNNTLQWGEFPIVTNFNKKSLYSLDPASLQTRNIPVTGSIGKTILASDSGSTKVIAGIDNRLEVYTLEQRCN